MVFLNLVPSNSTTATSLLLSSRISVFSWLIFRLEYVPNKLITLIRLKWDGLSQTKVVISSANVTKLNFIPIHFNALELTIILGCLQNKDPEQRRPKIKDLENKDLP